MKTGNNAVAASVVLPAKEQAVAEGNETAKNTNNQPRFSTPEKVFAEFKAAMAAANSSIALSCLTDESQKMMAGIVGMTVGAVVIHFAIRGHLCHSVP